MKAFLPCRLSAALMTFIVSMPGAAPAQTARPRPLIIGVLSYETGAATAPDSVSRSFERGLQLGFEEAGRTARLFGREVREKRIVIKRTEDALHAANVMARTTNMSALLVTNPELIPAAERLTALHYAVVVVRTLPSAIASNCSNFSFTIYPSADELTHAELWHSSLQRFGALELNDRYRARWKTGMTGEAWAAWLAVKILSEASLRTQSVEPFIILDYMKKSEFDGHKGWPLTFRESDHLLRQPIYVVSADGSKVVSEMPAGGRSETESAAQVLDAILPPRAGASCESSK